MSINPTVCCVITLDTDNRILLIKRGRDPYVNKWSLISGIGYIKKDINLEDGVVDEVVGDITALPVNVKKLFQMDIDLQRVVVFDALVNPDDVVPVSPYVIDFKWCTESELNYIDDLAFNHGEIIKRYLGARDASKC